MSAFTPHPASYRDPSGFVFEMDGQLYRQVNLVWKAHFDHFIQSGLYDELTGKGWLVPHETISGNLTGSDQCYVTLRPRLIRFISYPYEWSFDMLKDAALLTLQLAKAALAKDMVLKDASPYNIQWQDGHWVFIDTLSFEKLSPAPWIAYRQFCECFLGPLLIMHYSGMHWPGLLQAWPDGVPLDVIRSLLPRRSRFSLPVYLHIHLHAKIAARKPQPGTATPVFTKQKHYRVLSSLEFLVSGLKTPALRTHWAGYYEEAGTRDDYLDQKKAIVTGWILQMPAVRSVADLGANRGVCSKWVADDTRHVLAADQDAFCINQLYVDLKKEKERNILPLIADLSNPTPATGLNGKEHASFLDRVRVDLVMALALVHHLAIGKNIPLAAIANTLKPLTRYLLIEWVPREDPRVREMLAFKKDIYDQYTEAKFTEAFGDCFRVLDRKEIPGSARTLYLMEKK